MLTVDEGACHVFALVNIGKYFAENYDEAKMLVQNSYSVCGAAHESQPKQTVPLWR